MLTNYYRCANCGYEWEDEWSCACDDECGECGTVMTPYDPIGEDEDDEADDETR